VHHPRRGARHGEVAPLTLKLCQLLLGVLASIDGVSEIDHRATRLIAAGAGRGKLAPQGVALGGHAGILPLCALPRSCRWRGDDQLTAIVPHHGDLDALY
jgi:hypothetical protein